MFGWFFCCGSADDTEAVQSVHLAMKPRWKSSSVSLRGHLVRTYNHDIERDFYMDREHELGKGGCGVVVVGEHKETRQQYAIKIVNKATAERGRLDRELKLMKDVDHANIVRLFSVYDVPSNMYFVMELCLGGHLGNLLSRQPQKFIDEDWAKNLCRQMLSAVAHIHGRGIAHRDIKLQNILVDSANDRTAQLKLIDFGYGSRFIGALPMRTKCGTPYTTAPEVIRECYDERCDIWSLGVVLYIMLCGRRPFEALDIAGPLSDAGKAAMIANILAGRYHFNHKPFQRVSKAGMTFVKMLLHQDYRTRIRAYEALENPWFNDTKILSTQSSMLTSAKSFRAINNIRRSICISDMQRTGMVALVFGINARSAVDLRSVFQSFDRDGSGTISKEEFHGAINVVMPELTADDIDRLFAIVDMDHNQTISYTEFLAATLDPREVDMEELSKAFKLLDEDGNGFISKDELRKVVQVMIEQTRRSEASNDKAASPQPPRSLREEVLLGVLDEDVDAKVNEIFAEVDVNHDGRISLEEFFWAMTGGHQAAAAAADSPSSPAPHLSAASCEEAGPGAGPGGSHRNSLNNLNAALTGTTMTRTNSTSSRLRTGSYSHPEDDDDDDDDDRPAAGAGRPLAASLSQRHSLSAMRLSSSRIRTIVEASEHSSNNDAQTIDPMTLSAHTPLPFSGLLARSHSHRSYDRVLPTAGDFHEGSPLGSPHPHGESNLVFYDPHSELPDQSSTRGEHGEYSEGHGGGVEEEDPSSCSSYDNAKVRSLFGPPTPFGQALCPSSPGSAGGLNSGSRKVFLSPLTRRGTGDVLRDADASLDCDDKSDSRLARSASLGRGLLDTSSSNNVLRMSADTNLYSTSQRVKASPSLKRELSSRFDHSGTDERVDPGASVPPLGRAQSISSMLKARDFASGGELSSANVSQRIALDHSRGSQDSGLMASFSRIMHSHKYKS